MNVKNRPDLKKPRQFEAKIFEQGENTEEEFYDELYADTYQETVQTNFSNNAGVKILKKPRQLKHRSVSEMIL